MAQQQSNNQTIGIAMVTWRNVLLTLELLELSKTTRKRSNEAATTTRMRRNESYREHHEVAKETHIGEGGSCWHLLAEVRAT